MEQAEKEQRTRDALACILGSVDAVSQELTAHDVGQLAEHGYDTERKLRAANADSLQEAGLNKATAMMLAKAAGTSTGTGNAGKRFKKIYLMSLTGNDEKPYDVLKLQNVTRADVAAALRPAAIGLVAESQLPKHLAASEDLDVQLLEQVELEDGGRYIIIFAKMPVEYQVTTLEGWQRSITAGIENSAAELAVRSLLEMGHGAVERFCGTKKVRRPGSNKVVVEIDAAAIASNCALIVECKATLDKGAAKQLLDELDTIPQLIREGVQSVQPFKGKRLLGALCGKQVTTNSANYQEMKQLCDQNGVEIWLPSGKDFTRGDGCITSPNGRTCTSSPALHDARSTKQPCAPALSPVHPRRLLAGKGLMASRLVPRARMGARPLQLAHWCC